MLKDLVTKNRSYRRFYQETGISMETLRELVEHARLSATSTNRQPLKFMLSCEPDKNAAIFQHLTWARLIKWGGPVEGERPSAYIVILGDREIVKSFGCDHGIAAQSILLGAVEKGLGGCMIASINIEGLRKSLSISERFEVLLVLALGKPREQVVIEKVGSDGNVNYWRDAQSVHHVPKRSLDELIIG